MPSLIAESYKCAESLSAERENNPIARAQSWSPTWESPQTALVQWDFRAKAAPSSSTSSRAQRVSICERHILADYIRLAVSKAENVRSKISNAKSTSFSVTM